MAADVQMLNNSGNMNDIFPNEILEEIFTKLDSQTDLLQARLVCLRWRLILDEMVGYNILITNFYPTLALNLPTSEAQRRLPKNLKSSKSLKDHSDLSIRNLTIGIPGILDHENLTGVIERTIGYALDDIPPITFPHVIKSLSCFEPLSPTFFSSLPDMTTLTQLHLNLFSISRLKTSSSCWSTIKLRSLTKLSISDTQGHSGFNNMSAIFQLNNFLNHLDSPCLTDLDITYPVENLLTINNDSTRPIMKFIGRNQNVRVLSVGVSSPDQNFIAPTKEYLYPEDILEEMTHLGRKLNLSSAKLTDNHLQSLRPSLHVKAWTALLKTQTHLRYLQFSLKSSIDFGEDVMGVVNRNTETLRSISLGCFPCEISRDTRDLYFISINCSNFSHCIRLENLRTSDKFVNTLDLPRSLKKIYVDSMLTNRDAESILLNVGRPLELIELKDSRGGTPKGFGYGIAIESLAQFVREKKVKKLIIYAGSTDGKYPTNGIPNGDGCHPRTLRKRRPPCVSLGEMGRLSPEEFEEYLLGCIRIEWSLNEWGFYEDLGVKGDITVEEEGEIEENILLPEPFEVVEEVRSERVQHPFYKSNYLYSSFM